MVRVLHVLSDSMPAGAIQQLRTLCGDDSVDHHIVSLERNSQCRAQLKASLPSITWCGRTGSFDPTFIVRFGKQLRRLDPDVIHCWGNVVDRTFRLANHWQGDRPIISAASDSHSHRNIHYVATTESARDTLATSGCPAGQISVIRKGVAVPQTSPSTSNVGPVSSLHAELNLATETRFFAIIGDLNHESRFEDAMWGYDLWAVIRPDIHIVIFGNGPDRPRLEEFTNRMSAGHAVHFVDGTRERTNARLTQCIGAWHPGTRDCGLLLDAMAVGLPVVAADCHESRDMVLHGETGYVVPSGDPAESARKANLLLNDTSLAERMGLAARQRAEQHFGVAAMICEYRSLYERLTNAHRAAA